MSCSFAALIAVFQLKWITVATSQSKNTEWPFLSFRKDLLGIAPSFISFSWFVWSFFWLKAEVATVHLIDLNTVSCPKVNLYFGFWIWSKLSAKPEEISGGWPRMKKRNGKEERWSEQVCDLFTKPEEKKLHHLKLSLLSQKGTWATVPKMTFPCASGKCCVLTGIRGGM